MAMCGKCIVCKLQKVECRRHNETWEEFKGGGPGGFLMGSRLERRVSNNYPLGSDEDLGWGTLAVNRGIDGTHPTAILVPCGEKPLLWLNSVKRALIKRELDAAEAEKIQAELRRTELLLAEMNKKRGQPC
jgi:hypothetical protein